MIEKINNYANSLSAITNFVNTEITLDVIDLDKSGKLKEEPLKFFYTILLKINNGLDTCSFLFLNFLDKPHFVDSLIVICRSLISDSVIFWYLLERSENDEDKLIANIKALYYDHIDYTIRGVNSDFAAIYGDTKEISQSRIDEIKRNRTEYFDSCGNARIKPLNVSVRSALRYMASNTASKEKRLHIQKFYHHYDIFSKYEHLGDLTFQLIHRQYRDETKHELAQSIVESINCLVLPTVRGVLGAFPDISNKHSERLDVLVAKLKEHSI